MSIAHIAVDIASDMLCHIAPNLLCLLCELLCPLCQRLCPLCQRLYVRYVSRYVRHISAAMACFGLLRNEIHGATPTSPWETSCVFVRSNRSCFCSMPSLRAANLKKIKPHIGYLTDPRPCEVNAPPIFQGRRGSSLQTYWTPTHGNTKHKSQNRIEHDSLTCSSKPVVIFSRTKTKHAKIKTQEPPFPVCARRLVDDRRGPLCI